MIVKMKFINISGPRNDIDRVTDLYLSRYEIQLESALSELKTVDNLRPFVEINPYKDALGKAEEFAGYLVNADEISPDTCRLWDVNTNEKLDKDRFRRDLGNVEEAYNEVFKRLGLA